MVIGVLTGAVNVPSVAVSVYVLASSMLQPAKVATPATAVTGLAEHASTSPAGVVIANVTALVSVVTVLPPTSVMLTTGWVAKGWRLAASVGWVVNRSPVAGPIVMVTGSLIAGVKK